MIYGGTQKHSPSFPKDAHKWDKESMPKRADSISFLQSMLWMNRNIKLISRRNFPLASLASITSSAWSFPIQPRKFRLAETLPSHLYGGVGYGNTSDQSSCMTVSPIRSPFEARCGRNINWLNVFGQRFGGLFLAIAIDYVGCKNLVCWLWCLFLIIALIGIRLPTKRAVDGGDSAAFSSIFLALFFSAPKQNPSPPHRH